MADGVVGRPRDQQVLLVVNIEAARLFGRALDLEPTRLGVGPGGDRPGLGCRQTAPGQIERVPAKAEAPAERHDGDKGQRHSHAPAERAKGAQNREAPHGNTLRSSSKCGPSRRVGQSPPQTIAVPCRAAAALNAAAMRGYSGQSHRT